MNLFRLFSFLLLIMASSAAWSAATYSLSFNEWRIITLPAQPPAGTSTVEAIIGDDLPGTHGINWKVFKYDASVNEYQELMPQDTLEPGEGYWVIYKFEGMPSVSLDMPGDSQEINNQIVNIASNLGAQPAQWNLVGYPFAQTSLVDQLRIRTSGEGCLDACTLSEAKDKDLVHNEIWMYNGQSYKKKSAGSTLQPWEGYWAASLEGSRIHTLILEAVTYSGPFDRIVYSELEMELPINVGSEESGEEAPTVTLTSAPVGMSFDKTLGRLLWKPSLSDEGTDKTVVVEISHGNDTRIISFILHVAKPRLLLTSIENGELVVTDDDSSLKGLSIRANDDAVLSDYRLYSLNLEDTPEFTEGETIVGETLLVKGNIAKNVQVTMPLKGLLAKEDLASFHTKSYFGEGWWRRIDYNYDFQGTIDEPIYTLNTNNFFGLISFIGNFQGVRREAPRSSDMLMKSQINEGIHCTPKTWFFGMLTDDDNQVCIFDERPGFLLQIFNYTKTSLSSNTSVEEIASWVLKAQRKLDELNMPYRAYTAFSFESINVQGRLGETGNYSSVDGGIFSGYPIIFNFKLSRIDPYKIGNNKKKTQITLYHEYFHQSQGAIQNTTIGDMKANWLVEGSAVWFSDFVDNESGYAFRMFSSLPIRLLSFGLQHIATHTYGGSTWGSKYQGTINSNAYDRGLFLRMLGKHCIDFSKYVPYLFIKDNNDPTSLQHLADTVYSANCDFGTPFGDSNKNAFENSLLYYQYVSEMKQDIGLITDFGNLFGFDKQGEYSFKINVGDWSSLNIEEYKDS